MRQFKYEKRPDFVIEQLRIRRQNGESVTALANESGIHRSHLSRVLRGKFRASAGGPIAPSGSPVPLTAEERAAILDFVLQHRRHEDGPPSLRSLSEKLGRDRFNMAVRATTKRAVDLTERLFSYISKGENIDDCWNWTGGIIRRSVTLADGTEKVYVMPRLMDGPNRSVNPRRLVYEFATGRALTASEHLVFSCGNELCVNWRHCGVMGE